MGWFSLYCGDQFRNKCLEVSGRSQFNSCDELVIRSMESGVFVLGNES